MTSIEALRRIQAKLEKKQELIQQDLLVIVKELISLNTGESDQSAINSDFQDQIDALDVRVTALEP